MQVVVEETYFMQFHIPQYIELEDKIFGSLTFKQGLYIAGGAGGAYLVYRIIPFTFIAIPLIVGIGVLTWALAFYPVEKLGKPFVNILEAAFYYTVRGKLYTWKKSTKESIADKNQEFISSQPSVIPSVPYGKLSSASHGLDVLNPKKKKKKL